MTPNNCIETDRNIVRLTQIKLVNIYFSNSGHSKRYTDENSTRIFNHETTFYTYQIINADIIPQYLICHHFLIIIFLHKTNYLLSKNVSCPKRNDK